MQHSSRVSPLCLTTAALLAAAPLACDKKSGDTEKPGADSPTVTNRETAPAVTGDDDPDAIDDSVSDAMTPSPEDEAMRAEDEANRARRAAATDDDEYEDDYGDEADEEDFEEDFEDGR